MYIFNEWHSYKPLSKICLLTIFYHFLHMQNYWCIYDISSILHTFILLHKSAFLWMIIKFQHTLWHHIIHIHNFSNLHILSFINLHAFPSYICLLSNNYSFLHIRLLEFEWSILLFCSSNLLWMISYLSSLNLPYVWVISL